MQAKEVLRHSLLTHTPTDCVKSQQKQSMERCKFGVAFQKSEPQLHVMIVKMQTLLLRRTFMFLRVSSFPMHSFLPAPKKGLVIMNTVFILVGET